jgi:hypothetical protein
MIPGKFLLHRVGLENGWKREMGVAFISKQRSKFDSTTERKKGGGRESGKRKNGKIISLLFSEFNLSANEVKHASYRRCYKEREKKKV